MTRCTLRSHICCGFLGGIGPEARARALPGTFTHDATTRMMAMNRGDLRVPDMCKAMSYVTLPVVI